MNEKKEYILAAVLLLGAFFAGAALCLFLLQQDEPVPIQSVSGLITRPSPENISTAPVLTVSTGTTADLRTAPVLSVATAQTGTVSRLDAAQAHEGAAGKPVDQAEIRTNSIPGEQVDWKTVLIRFGMINLAAGALVLAAHFGFRIYRRKKVDP